MIHDRLAISLELLSTCLYFRSWKSFSLPKNQSSTVYSPRPNAEQEKTMYLNQQGKEEKTKSKKILHGTIMLPLIALLSILPAAFAQSAVWGQCKNHIYFNFWKIFSLKPKLIDLGGVSSHLYEFLKRETVSIMVFLGY